MAWLFFSVDRWSEYLSAGSNIKKRQRSSLISLTNQKYRCIHNLLKTEPERKVSHCPSLYACLHPYPATIYLLKIELFLFFSVLFYNDICFIPQKATILRLQQQVLFGHSWPWSVKSVARLRYYVWSCYNIFSDLFILFHLFYFLLSILGTFHYPFWYICYLLCGFSMLLLF